MIRMRKFTFLPMLVVLAAAQQPSCEPPVSQAATVTFVGTDQGTAKQKGYFSVMLDPEQAASRRELGKAYGRAIRSAAPHYVQTLDLYLADLSVLGVISLGISYPTMIANAKKVLPDVANIISYPGAGPKDPGAIYWGTKFGTQGNLQSILFESAADPASMVLKVALRAPAGLSSTPDFIDVPIRFE